MLKNLIPRKLFSYQRENYTTDCIWKNNPEENAQFFDEKAYRKNYYAEYFDESIIDSLEVRTPWLSDKKENMDSVLDTFYEFTVYPELFFNSMFLVSQQLGKLNGRSTILMKKVHTVLILKQSMD